MRHFKKIASFGVMLCLMLCVFGCSSEESVNDISSLTFTRSSDFILDSVTEVGYIRTEGTSEFATDMIKIVSEDDSIATAKTVRSSGHLISFELTPVSNGETYIYAVTSDGSITSEKLKVVVFDGVTVPTESLEEATEAHSASTEHIADTYPMTRPLDVDPEESESSEMPAQASENADSETSPDTEEYYVLNTNTKKIHHKDCSSVDKISPNNYDTTDDVQSMLDEGYVWCKLCGK